MNEAVTFDGVVTAVAENPRKRKNLLRWRRNRLRRLHVLTSTGRATERQFLRALQLELQTLGGI